MFRLLFILSVLSVVLATQAFASNGTDSLLDQSYQQSQSGKLDEALATLQKAVKQDPSSSTVHMRLGGVRVLRREYDAGIKDFQKAIMLDGKNASAFVGLAVAYLHQGKYGLARAALDEAGRIDESKKDQIAKVQAWIEQRTQGKGSVH